MKRTALFFALALGLTNTAFGQYFPVGNWRLVDYCFGSEIKKPAAEQKITFNVNRDGGVGGDTGCNVFGGDYTYEKSKFKVTNIISTMRACEEPAFSFESDYLDVLRSATEFKVRKTMLFVEDKKTRRWLSFVRVYLTD